jgi:hypothetical protein
MRRILGSFQIKSALSSALWLIICILGASCASTEKKTLGLDEKLLPTHFTLESGPAEKKANPLPDYIPIYVRSYAGDQLLERQLGYRGWDFNKDGVIDMLEVLDAKGQVLRRAYDWNRDGQVDEVQN